jgi:hypothetical protein
MKTQFLFAILVGSISFSVPAQVLKLEGKLPPEIQLSGGASYMPSVKAADLPLLTRRKCYNYNTIDLGEGRSWQWVPQVKQTRFHDSSNGNDYKLIIPLTYNETPKCQYATTALVLEIKSKRTPYRPGALYFKNFDSNNPAHQRIPLSKTKIICSLERDIEVCRITPQHVKGDDRTMLLHEDLAQSFRVDIELK